MGMLHIYCGTGKGKTTAALGLALRAAGNDMRVHFVQFLKGGPTSELHALEQLPQITVRRCDRHYGFTRQLNEEKRQALIACHNALLLEAADEISQHRVDLLILDEFHAAYQYGLLDRTLADHVVLERSEEVELVLTGRNPDPKFLDAADYISEIQCIRHPYEKGIPARKGIEF